ncbi:MAG TPA: hypothetical protein VFW65_34165 [Pseudonocardiaceae bacterium]|nr:hypothetical protein [Pseudonocardiaceae bacterium]
MTRSGGPIWRVVEALLRVPVLKDRSERDLVSQLLTDEWESLTPIAGHENAVHHLVNLVDACRSRPRGLATLMAILDRLDLGTTHLAEVHRVVDPMIALEIWTADETEEVFSLLKGMTIPNIAELYQAAAGPWAPDLRPKATLRDAFSMLETLTSDTDGVPRAIIFVELVSASVRPDIAMQLRQWSDRRAAAIGVSDQLVHARTRPPLSTDHASLIARPEPHAPAYLVLQVQREGVVGDRYRLSHWRQLGDDEWQPERGLDRTGVLTDIQHAVAQLMESTEEEWAPHEPTIFVEFVLPEELLNLAVDQWSWDTDPRMPEPIGCHFHVVIRSLERMATPKWHRPWYRRWRQLQEQLATRGAIAPDSGYWSTPGNGSIRRIMSDFEQGPALVALVPSAPPLTSTLGSEEVAVGFRKGVPVMIWHRQNCRSDEFVSAVTMMLHGDDPNDILERVRLLRLHGFAAGADAHVGTHLSLLWDDPRRKVTPDRPGPPGAVVAAS